MKKKGIRKCTQMINLDSSLLFNLNCLIIKRWRPDDVVRKEQTNYYPPILVINMKQNKDYLLSTYLLNIQIPSYLIVIV